MTSTKNWRETFSPHLIEQIEAAVDQAKANVDYEKDWPLKETIQRLRAIHDHCKELSDAIANLSPVGRSAIWTLARERGDTYGRNELRWIDREIAKLAPLADVAVDRLLAMHSPAPEKGQGSGSALGRDPDLRAIRVGEGRHRSEFATQLTQLALRSPKDKFAVAVMRALVRDGHPLSAPAYRGQRYMLESLLADIWNDSGIEQTVSWSNIGKNRTLIFALAKADFKSVARANRRTARRNRLLLAVGRRPPLDWADH